tara:strand:- start:3381 stop:4601 length:1221 start_codon:yes stop_codon:yes gene_type:complete
MTAINSKKAALKLAALDSHKKNSILKSLLKILKKEEECIYAQNLIDIEAAKKKGLSDAFIQRLEINKKVFKEMIKGIENIIKLEDPIGEVIEQKKLKNGLDLKRITTPLGVVLIIYESRPNVTIDVSAICIKSGNAVILKGGSDAKYTNESLFDCIQKSLKDNKIDPNTIQFVEREQINELLKDNTNIDVVIPRGGKELIKNVTENSSIPVIKHYEGICNIYVDKEADIESALKIIHNAKVQKPSACNAAENLVIHNEIAKDILPKIKETLEKDKVEIRGDKETQKIIKCEPATTKDFRTEYLDNIIAVKIVKESNEAIDFINNYGSHHSDAILTENHELAEEFLNKIDSAAVFHNATTRFTDGAQFEMGCEIGISTDKLHARGPMGLKEMCSYKFVIKGKGHVRK